MAIGAHQVALGDLVEDLLPREPTIHHRGQLEVLPLSRPVIKVHHVRVVAVGAVNARAVLLECPEPLLQVLSRLGYVTNPLCTVTTVPGALVRSQALLTQPLESPCLLVADRESLDREPRLARGTPALPLSSRNLRTSRPLVALLSACPAPVSHEERWAIKALGIKNV